MGTKVDAFPPRHRATPLHLQLTAHYLHTALYLSRHSRRNTARTPCALLRSAAPSQTRVSSL